MQKLRKSEFPKQLYADLANMLKTAWADETTVLPDLWEFWRCLIMEFHLHDHAPIVTWTALITNLQSEGITIPEQLTDLTLEQVIEEYNMGAIPDMPKILRQAATRQLMALGPKQALPLTGQTNVELLLDQIRAKNIDDTKIAHEKKSLAKRIGAPADLDQLTPGNKTKWLVNSTAPQSAWIPSSRRAGSSTRCAPPRDRFAR